MKRQIIYLLMFVFAFILPSFSIPQEVKKNEKIVQKTFVDLSDSVYVNLQFQNPKVVVTDERSKMATELKAQAALTEELITTVKDVGSSIKELATLTERRYESDMDRLQRRTQYSLGQINKFITQKNVLNIILGVITLIYLVVIAFMYNISYRRLKESIIGYLFMWVIAWLGSLLILYLIWPTLMGSDYQTFYKLIQLPPF